MKPLSNNLNVHLFSLTIGEFVQLQKSLISEEIKNISPKTGEDQQKSLFNFNQAAEYLNVSKPTFSKLRKSGKIKGMKVSENRILFSKVDLDMYLQNCREN
ncbi:DNA binding domain-containing protein, excisionase family [Spirosomataceae bacterium TFI 002]|nr:DNA binding domain-containing protein, excisionase family [Spirosomataceae bacterium TFI 002]